MNKCIISSNNSHEREYEVETSSALKAAQELGRCEGGEDVSVYSPKNVLISKAKWTPEDGGKY